MGKQDLKRELKSLYAPGSKTVVDVVVPPFNFLMIDGEGDPNSSSAYKAAVEALFSVSYTAKFDIRKRTGTDYAVMPLEGLWWADDLSTFERGERNAWKWTMMIMQPPVVRGDVIGTAIDAVRRRKGLEDLDRLRFEAFDEGHCAQVLHVGPFSEEGPTIQRVHEYIRGRGRLRGKHHEIYLSDVRKASPDKWKTIIRQPMETARG
jgi:hypothetical protein